MAHKHSVYDTNMHFNIDPVTRAISNQVAAKSTLIQGDHNSERFTFELPRRVDGHDMTLCDKVEVHYINISADKKEQSADVYFVDDLGVSPDSDDVAIFSWLISGNATKYEGVLTFLVRFVCLTGETIDYAWHTGIYSNVNVGEGMNNGEAVLIEYSDVLAAWEERLLGSIEGIRASAEASSLAAEQARAAAEEAATVVGNVEELLRILNEGSVTV